MSPTDSIIANFLSHGPIGLVAIVALYFAWSKDKEVKAAQEARLADSKASTEKLLDVVGKVYAAVDQLATTSDKLYESTRK